MKIEIRKQTTLKEIIKEMILNDIDIFGVIFKIVSETETSNGKDFELKTYIKILN
jgi:hypothetical protein